MDLSKDLLYKLTEFRHYLHSEPELSGSEIKTSSKILNFLKETSPSDTITGIGGHGVAAIYNSGQEGPTVLLRADMDALPIQESNTFDYKSVSNGVAHLCGHDGHSTILVGVGHYLKSIPITKGKVVLLFQPAEEVGRGAAAVIADPKFNLIKPDYAFALHNLPGFEKGSVFLRNQTFASASTGLIAKLKGLSSHAAHPEDGNSPDKALAKIMLELNEVTTHKTTFKDFALLTIIHAKLGEIAFGTTPGKATLMATLRTYLDSDMEILKAEAENIIRRIAKEHDLNQEISYTEEFPATINSANTTSIVSDAATKLGIPVKNLEQPFRWSEDFGYFTQVCPATLFGIGSGVNHPQLHNEDYDFPDDIIEPSILLFAEILNSILSH